MIGDVVAFVNLRIHRAQHLLDRRRGDAQMAGWLRQRETEVRDQVAAREVCAITPIPEEDAARAPAP